MAHFALLWKARTIEKYRQNYENEKENSLQETNTPIPQKSLSQKLRCYRQDTQKRFSKIFHKIYPEGSSLSHFFMNLNTDQTCLNLVFKSFLGFLIGLALTYLCFLFFMFQLSISPFHATVVSSIIGILLTMGLAFSYRIRCLIFLLLPQFFSRAGRFTLTCYALVLILTGPATNTLKNSEVLSESMACRQEQIKTLVKDVTHTARKPLNSIRYSIKIMVVKIRLFTRQLKENLLKVNRLTLSVLETIHSTFMWLRWLSDVCNETMGSPYERCIKVLKEEANDYKESKPNIAQIKRLADKAEEICSNVKKYKRICVFTDFVNGSFVATIKRRLREFTQRIKEMLYLQIHVHHSYSFSSNASDSASRVVVAGIITEIRKRADPLLTWLSWSSCVTSLFLLLIIFRAKYYQHMFETRSRFDNKYITKEIRDLDLNRLRHGRETILPLNRRERSKYVSTTSFRLVASEKIHLNRSIVFMTITTFKLLIHMVADYSLYWVLMTIQHHGKNQTPMPYGVPNAGMHITGTGRIADIFRSLLAALTSPLEIPHPLTSTCLPKPNPPDFQRYTQIGILIFLLWFFSLFEPYGLRLRHVVMGLYRPERAKARAEWLYNHILRLRGGFMKCARRKLHRTYKYHSEEKYTFRKWLNMNIPFWLRYILRIQKEEVRCLLCGTKELPEDPNTRHQKCDTKDCPGVYCRDCFSDIDELCAICLSPNDYDDFSDVSFEKGSSDESEDDSGERRPNPVHYESDNDILDRENDDVLLPEPLRDKNKCKNKTEISKFASNSNEITDIKKQTFDTKINLWIIKKIKPFSGHISKFICDYIITSLTKVIKILWKIFYIFKANNFLQKLIHSLASHHSMRETKKILSDKNTHNNNKTRDDNYKQIRKHENGMKNDKKENKNDGTNKINPSTSKDLNNKKNEKENDLKQEKIIKDEVSWCYFNRLNTIMYACWSNMKFNLFNASKSQSILSKKLSYDKNYKTRKKDEKMRRKTENEKARQYRIFAYLAEQEWVVKKTMTYKSPEECSLDNEKPNRKIIDSLREDIFRQNMYPMDPKKEPASKTPILERHLFICDHCRYQCFCPGNPINRLCGSKSLPNIQNICRLKNDIEKHCQTAAPECTETVSKKHSKVDDDDLNTNKKSFIVRIMSCLKSSCCAKKKKAAEIKAVKDIKKETLNQATSTGSPKICNARKKKPKKPQPQNLSTHLGSSYDLKTIKRDDSLFKNKCNKSKQYEIDSKINNSKNKIYSEKQEDLPNKCNNVELERKEESIKNKCEIGKQIGQDCKNINCKNYNDTEIQKDYACQTNNVESEFKKVSIKNNSNKIKQKGHLKKNIDTEKPKDLQANCQNANSEQKIVPPNKKCQTEKRDGLQNEKNIVVETDSPMKNKTCMQKRKQISTKHNAENCKQQTFHMKCDALCPEECTCNGKGVVVGKCDPLCPDECTCNGKGVLVKKCDQLCPEDCTCGGHGIIINKCDPLCPEECPCGGHGITINKCDPFCPEVCPCGGHGIITEKCDPLCPENCKCNGHGVSEEHNYLCSGDCCCKNVRCDVGTQPDELECKTESTDLSINSSCCEICGGKTKICPNCIKNKSPGSTVRKNYSFSKCEESSESIKNRWPKIVSEKYDIFKKKSDGSVSKCTDKNILRGEKSKLPKKQSEKRAKKDKSGKKIKKKKQSGKIKPDSWTEIDCCLPFNYVSCVSEATMTPEDLYCTCAIQCLPLKRRSKTTEQGENDTEEDDSDLSCDCCDCDTWKSLTTVRHVYIEKPRPKIVRRKFVTRYNQCVGTCTPLMCNVGTITEEKGLMRKNIVYIPKKHGIYLWDHNFKQDRAVSTKKTVSFRSRVQLIPSINDHIDIYTPSRYLLESQRYYNELYTHAAIYPISIFQNHAYRRTSYGSRSYSSRRGRRAKRLEGCSYIKQKHISGKRENPVFNSAKYRKSQKK